MENKEKKRVADVISAEEIRKWKNGDVVTISAPCGAGKSYFIKNVLYKYAKSIGKKILMMIHRSACVNQFAIEIENAGKNDVIDIRTYQSIEFALINGNYGVFSKDYGFVVSDEFHYFMEDSGFNCFTDLSYNAIVKYPNAVKIFMSATGDVMAQMISKSACRKSKMYHYTVQADFSHIASLNFFFQPETMRTLAYRFKLNGKKAVFFCQSIQQAHSLYNEFRDCSIFLCGKNSANGKKFYTDVNEEKINQMLEKQRFEEQFLFCTSCFDAGANIIDPNLHVIVVDMMNISSLIQCVGRKRSQGSNDKIHLFIKGISNKQIGGLISKRRIGLQRADFLMQNDTRTYVEKYGRNNFDKFHGSLIYDEPMSKRNKNTCTKLVNMMIYNKYQLDIETFEEILKVGYTDYIGNIFQFGKGFERYYMNFDEGDLSDYLGILASSNVVMLTANDRKPFIEKLNVRHDGKLLKSKNSLNAALTEKKYNFRIEEFETSKMIDGKKKNFKSAWRVIKQ